jgi:hypothetical protein
MSYQDNLDNENEVKSAEILVVMRGTESYMCGPQREMKESNPDAKILFSSFYYSVCQYWMQRNTATGSDY